MLEITKLWKKQLTCRREPIDITKEPPPVQINAILSILNWHADRGMKFQIELIGSLQIE